MHKLIASVQTTPIKAALSSTIVAAFSLFFSSQAFAHGEDKPGPHGGYIRMPGAFHTELVQEGKSSFSVYLLDMEWKNPTTADSSVEVALKKGKKGEIKLPCQVRDVKFSCTLPKGTKIQAGDQIFISAKRQGMQGNVATYPLPLTFSQPHANH